LRQLAALASQLPLETVEIEGLLTALVMHVGRPDVATKLRMAIDQMPKSRRAANDEFLAALDTLDASVLARGRAMLDAMSDEEWAALLEDDEETEGGA